MPLETEPRDAQDATTFDLLFMSIGRFTASWGHVEQALDAIIRIIHYGNIIPPPEQILPSSMKRKIRYFRKSLKHVDDPEVKRAYIQICDGLLHHVGTRNDIIHGHLIHIEPDGSTAHFGRFDIDDTKAPPRSYPFTVSQINKGTSEARAIARLLV